MLKVIIILIAILGVAGLVPISKFYKFCTNEIEGCFFIDSIAFSPAMISFDAELVCHLISGSNPAENMLQIYANRLGWTFLGIGILYLLFAIGWYIYLEHRNLKILAEQNNLTIRQVRKKKLLEDIREKWLLPDETESL